MSDQHIGVHFDNYHIVERVGEGGMGTVFRARDVDLDMFVALKMLKPMLSYDQSFTRRFRSEAQSLARLSHPNIVRVLRLGENEHGLYIVMEFVDGESLDQFLFPHRSKPMPLDQVISIAKQVLQAIGHAHQQRVIHRDIKPSNIMVDKDGRVKMTDFGLAKIQSDAEATVTQMTAGTLHYMSPEQILTPTQVDHRTDIYAVGMTLYAMLNGKVPFDKKNSRFSIEEKIVKGQIPSIRDLNPSVPKDLAQVVMKALAQKPEQRYATAEDMLAALSAVSLASQASAGASARPKWGVAAAVGAAAVVIAVLLLVYPGYATMASWIGLGSAGGAAETTVTAVPATAAPATAAPASDAVRVVSALRVQSFDSRGDTLSAELVIGPEGSGMYPRTGRYTPLDDFELDAGRYRVSVYREGYSADPRQEIVEVNPAVQDSTPLTFTLSRN